MATYTLFSASYGSNYANVRVRILEQGTGTPAIIMASATSGNLSSHGNAITDSSGNLAVYLDSSKTFVVWYNQFILTPGGISLATEVQRTSAQLTSPPTQADIGLGSGATFFLDTNPAALYRISSDKSQYVLVTGAGGGASSFAGLTDAVTASIATTNTSIVNALANKAPINSTQVTQVSGGATTALLNSAKTALKDPAGGADVNLGVSTFAGLTDKTTASIATTNTSVVNALATKVTTLGIFASSGALQTAFPAANNTGSLALVGSSTPYTVYISSGASWVGNATGSTTFASLTDAASASIATTNTSVSTALAGKVGNVGTYATTGALPKAFPAASNTGSLALVGSSAPYTQYISNGSAWVPFSTGGGGTLGFISGTISTQSDLSSALNTKQNVPSSWDGTTPALTSSVNPIPLYGSNAFTYTGGGGATLDGFTFQTGDLALWTGSAFTKIVLGGGYVGTFASPAALQTAYPAASNAACIALVNSVIYTSNGTSWLTKAAIPTAISTGTTLLDTYDCANLVCTSTPALTINSGLKNGFGCSIKGAFTTAGTATITDLRATTGTAFCCLVQSDTAGTGTTYDLVGTK